MRRVWLLIGLFALLAPVIGTQAASGFANPQFEQQWKQGEAITPNFWGPLPLAQDGRQEDYKEATGGQRLVQYFDKGRMELTNGAVTNGLLATEITTGQIQKGDATFQAQPSPSVAIAGDPDNPGPTYAQLSSKGKALFDAAPKQTGNYAQAVVSSAGDISVSNAGPTAAATFAAFDDATKHNVPKAFADYRDKAGLATIGLAIAEPFATTVKVGGQPKQVLVQVFERRVLTYTDSNPDAFKVEMGNIGQHYYQWRYGSSTPSSAPPTTAPPAAVQSPSPGPIGLNLISSGAGQDGSKITIAFIVANTDPTNAIQRSQYQVAAYDASGTVLKTDSGSIEIILPGQQLGLVEEMYQTGTTPVARVDVQLQSGKKISPAGLPTALTTDKAAFMKGQYSSRATGIVKSSYGKDLKDVAVYAIVYDSAGKIIGGGYNYVNFIPANGQSAIDMSVTYSGNVAKVDLFALPTILSLP